MTINIVEHQLPDDTHLLYSVYLYDDKIQTLVTHSPSIVESWLIETQRIRSKHLNHLIVGLDTEWRPPNENPVAILQLCVGHRCLIFQILHSPSIPRSLVTFLGNASYTFVGADIAKDVEKLLKHYKIRVVNAVDLRELAKEELKKASLKRLAKEVLGIEMPKPQYITMSSWDDEWLTHDQVGYACVDAFVSFKAGRSLMLQVLGMLAFSEFGIWMVLYVVYYGLSISNWMFGRLIVYYIILCLHIGSSCGS